jgi:hypothetical protein
MFHKHFKELCKDIDIKMENQGEKIVITLSGDKEKLETVEKKLNAIKELCCSDDDCCDCC